MLMLEFRGRGSMERRQPSLRRLQRLPAPTLLCLLCLCLCLCLPVLR